MRKAAIQRAGEYAPENLVFKELRNRGYVEKVGVSDTLKEVAGLCLMNVRFMIKMEN